MVEVHTDFCQKFKEPFNTENLLKLKCCALVERISQWDFHFSFWLLMNSYSSFNIVQKVSFCISTCFHVIKIYFLAHCFMTTVIHPNFYQDYSNLICLTGLDIIWTYLLFVMTGCQTTVKHLYRNFLAWISYVIKQTPGHDQQKNAQSRASIWNKGVI